MVIKCPDNNIGYMLQTPEEYQGGVAPDGGLNLYIRTIYGGDLTGPFHLKPYLWRMLCTILYMSKAPAILHADIKTSPAEVFAITKM